MTPAARVQAAIELLDEIIHAAASGGAAADTLIARYFKTRRYAGSKDRRAVRDFVYASIRRSGERPSSGRAAMLGLADDQEGLAALFDGSAHGPAIVAPDEERAAAAVVPAWLAPRFDPLLDASEQAALLERAPLDLRANRLKTDRDEVLPQLQGATPSPLSPIGIRLAEGTAIEDHSAYRGGLIEVQDEGSQLLVLACKAAPGMSVVDLCAGAGGKTLALAGEMANQGRIIASDVDRSRLSRMTPRLERAGASIVEARLLNPGAEFETLSKFEGSADIVLVDAPCSGTGTWRRNPETRWRLDEKRLARLGALQSSILDVAARLVKPGGYLVYAVCSVLAEEGRGQADAFARRHSSFVPEQALSNVGRPSGVGTLLTPQHDGTDGFFVARWQLA